MVEQLEISRTAERAWIMAGGAGLVVGTSSDSSKPRTHFHVDLICRNKGKTPAWITRLTGYSEIVSETSLAALGPSDAAECTDLDWDISIGAGKEEKRYVEFECDGSIQGTSDCLSIFLLVEYRDIFGRTRTTSIAYFIQYANPVRRLELRDRIRIPEEKTVGFNAQDRRCITFPPPVT